ncbi:MAG: hypothetical protein CL676_02965 [Bdellovibrionaceae bacterium]|nr:hypothetical protein [Pseudobdellovibrionaceae bacterium]|tara:strand:- start:7101 stop:7346 length:246 start_codon:yes stop_codon:yes gene_type:complete
MYENFDSEDFKMLRGLDTTDLHYLKVCRKILTYQVAVRFELAFIVVRSKEDAEERWAAYGTKKELLDICERKIAELTAEAV